MTLRRAKNAAAFCFRRGAGDDADAGALELQRARRAELRRQHEALAVEIVDAGEGEPVAQVARHGPGRVARQQVDLFRLQRGEAVVRGKRAVVDLARVAEHGGGHRLAEIDVEAVPGAGFVLFREAGQALADAADESCRARARRRACRRRRSARAGRRRAEQQADRGEKRADFGRGPQAAAHDPYPEMVWRFGRQVGLWPSSLLRPAVGFASQGSIAEQAALLHLSPRAGREPALGLDPRVARRSPKGRRRAGEGA